MISVEIPQTHQVTVMVLWAFNIEYFLANEENLMKVGQKCLFVTAWLNAYVVRGIEVNDLGIVMSH